MNVIAKAQRMTVATASQHTAVSSVSQHAAVATLAQPVNVISVSQHLDVDVVTTTQNGHIHQISLRVRVSGKEHPLSFFILFNF